MPDFNPWIDVAICALVWVPMAGYLLFKEHRKSKPQAMLRGATRI